MTGTINRTLIAVFTAVVLTVSIAAQAQPAAAAQLTPLDYESTGLDGHPELSSGGVLDITLGRSIGANEVHRVVGAAPSTNYTVSADIFFATPCQNDDPFGPVTLEEGTLSTNPAGNGTFVTHIPGDAFDTAPPEFWVRWHLLTDGQTAYSTTCARIVLGT
jgi:hypothetical protein